jgi:hypothetical protein
MAFWLAHDHLLATAAMSLIIFAAAAPLAYIAAWLLVQGFLLGLVPAAAAAALGGASYAAGLHCVRSWIDGDDGFWNILARGLRRHGMHGAALALVWLTVAAALGVSVYFYAGPAAARVPVVGYALAAIALWALAAAAAAAPYSMAARVWKPMGVRQCIKTALLVLVDNIFLIGGMWLLTFVMGLAAFWAPPILVFVYGGASVCLFGAAYEMAARRYSPDEDEELENDPYLNRGWRDFLFPWKQ